MSVSSVLFAVIQPISALITESAGSWLDSNKLLEPCFSAGVLVLLHCSTVCHQCHGTVCWCSWGYVAAVDGPFTTVSTLLFTNGD